MSGRRVRPGLWSLLLCLLAVVLPTAGTAQAQISVTLQRPLAHLAMYDFSLPCEVAAIVHGENGTPEYGKFDVRIYETQLLRLQQTPGANSNSANSPEVSGTLSLLVLTSGEDVVGTMTTAGLSMVSEELTLTFNALPVPKSVNADGTVNWNWGIAATTTFGNMNVSRDFTGFLVPIEPQMQLMWPTTVYATVDGRKLEVVYVHNGEFVTKEVDVGEPVQRLLGIVDLDDHRTVLVVETSDGVRTVLVDRASDTVSLRDDVKVGYSEGDVTVAVPEQDGTIIATTLSLPSTEDTPLLYFPPLTLVKVRGADVLAVKPYRGITLAIVEVGDDVTLLAISPFRVDGAGPELLPISRVGSEGSEIEFAVSSPYGGSLFVTYDRTDGEIRVTESTSDVTDAAVPSVDVEFLSPSLANPDAHGGVKFDLTRDIELKDLSELADVEVVTDSGVTTGKLYRIETNWGRFYGVVVGDRLILIPETIHPMLHIGDRDVVREIEVDVEPSSDGTVTVVVHDPMLGDLKVPGCVVAGWSYRPRIFPTETLIEELKGRNLSVGDVTMGSFTPALVTCRLDYRLGPQETQETLSVEAKGTVRLPDGRTVDVEGAPILTLILKDDKLAVITESLPDDRYTMYVIDPMSGSVEQREVVAVVPTQRAGVVTTGSMSIAVLVPEEGAVRILITYPYPNAVSLLSALDALPVIAEVTVPAEGEPEDVRVVSVCPDGSTEVVCCTWTSGGERYAVAVDTREGKVFERAWVKDEDVYLPWEGKYLHVNTGLGWCDVVDSLPEGVEEVRIATETGGEQGEGQQGGERGGQEQGQQNQGNQGQGGQNQGQAGQPGQGGQGQQGNNQQGQNQGQGGQGNQNQGGQPGQGHQGNQNQNQGNQNQQGGKQGSPVLIPPVIPPRRRART